jgi:hypothetical protein
LEQLLEDALLAAWPAVTLGGTAAARRPRRAHDWEPQPGLTDAVLGLPDEPAPSVVAELKVTDVEDTLWDLLKAVSVMEAAPELIRAYLVVASEPRRWDRAECAELFEGDEPGRSRVWSTRDLLLRWERAC